MSSHTPLRGIRVLTLALNLPGPAAVMRLKAMGATCTKFEPLAGDGGSGDPMSRYRPQAYEHMHLGTKVVAADLKAPSGQKKLHALLQKTDVLITSFRPSALKKLGLDPTTLARIYPSLVQVSIVGAPGALAEEPGHDLTYMALSGSLSRVGDGHAPPPVAAEARARARMRCVSCSACGISSPWYTHTFTPMTP